MLVWVSAKLNTYKGKVSPTSVTLKETLERVLSHQKQMTPDGT